MSQPERPLWLLPLRALRWAVIAVLGTVGLITLALLIGAIAWATAVLLIWLV